MFLKEHIQEIFSTYGKIKMIDMPMNRLHPHLSKGYAYVEFESPDEAEKALKHMDGGRRTWRSVNTTPVMSNEEAEGKASLPLMPSRTDRRSGNIRDSSSGSSGAASSS